MLDRLVYTHPPFKICIEQAPGFTWEFHQYYREDKFEKSLSMIQGSEERGRRVETRGVGDGVENGFGVDQVGNVD
jgi:hypothetical protein